MKYSILSILTILGLVTFHSSINAQNEKQFTDSVLYVTPVDEAFMIDKKTRLNEYIAFSAAFEQKLSPSFSISPFAHFTYFKSLDRSYTSINYGAELRYYHKMKNLIKNKKQANNLSSNYFSLSYQSNTKTNFFKSHEIAIISDLSIGFGFGKTYKLSEESKCPIFKCYTNRKSAIKINLNNTLGFEKNNFPGFYGFDWRVYFNPNIIYEHKIANSAFSIENDLQVYLSTGSFRDNPDNSTSYYLNNNVRLKYYVHQKRDISNGKSGNNLSGQYIFAGSNFYTGKSDIIFYDTDEKIFKYASRTIESMGISAGYGIQKEVLKNLYIDIYLGASKTLSYDADGDYFIDKKVRLFSNVKAGLMF